MPTGVLGPKAIAEILRTEELKWRPLRQPNHQEENLVLTQLAQASTESTEKVFQILAERLRVLCKAGSAGVSLLLDPKTDTHFVWVATAGEFASLRGATLPRHYSPCGIVVQQNGPQLIVRPERAFPYIAELKVPVEEVLLVPFYRNGHPMGTIWVATHDDQKHFDREDLRLTTSLAQFASLACQSMAQQAEQKRAVEDRQLRRLITEELTHARARLDSASLADEVGFYEWNIVTNEVEGDANFFRIIPLDSSVPPKLRAASLFALVHPEDQAPTQALVKQALESAENYDATYRVIHQPNEVRWVRARGRVFRYADGRPLRLAGILLDITECKRAEEARLAAQRESEQAIKIYETVLSATDDFAYIFDTRGRFLYANRALLRVWGKRLQDIVGKTCYELGYPTWHADMHMREIAQVIATKQPIRGEVPFTGGSGISGIYDYIFTPVLGKDGEVEYIGGTTRDETDRRRRNDRDQLLIALDDATRPLTDANEITQKSAQLLGKQLGINRCAYATVHDDENTFDLTGDYNFRVPSIVGRYRFDQFGEACLNKMRAGETFIVEDTNSDPRTAPIRDIYLSHQIRSVICVPLHKSGRFVAAMAVHQNTPRAWQPHEVEMLVLVANRCWESLERTRVTRELALRETELQRVVNELAKAQSDLAQHANRLEQTVADRTARLRETVSELETFSYSVSHDLRGPLRVMRSFAEALREDCSEELNVLGKDYIRRIVSAAERMDRVIQDVLEYSLVVRNELPLEPISLDCFLTGLLEGYPEFEKAEITVEKPLPIILGNTAALTQCFANLIGNALKFVSPGVTPQITIYGDEENGMARIHVEDNGIGIDKSMHDSIFGAFYRLDPKYEGTGIGLAIVRKAVERMGGTVTVDSELGRGSTFKLNLPTASPSST